MKMFRAQRTERVRIIDNSPAARARGRWFVRTMAAAQAHAARLDGEIEIVALDIDDAIAESFRVAIRPHTDCGLSPIDHAEDPANEYLVPAFQAARAVRRKVINERPKPIPVEAPRSLLLPLDMVRSLVGQAWSDDPAATATRLIALLEGAAAPAALPKAA